MSRKIVWSDFLKEEAIYRFWYTLENNNFKNAIKAAQKQGKMNYANMHNALYSGLYYPEKNYEYPYRAIKDIRTDRALKHNATIANFMERHEILMNIHAMNESARAIRKLAPFGYNAKLFAKEFNLIGKLEAEVVEKAKIKNKLLFNSHPQTEDELVKNKPNRYNLSRSFAKQQKTKTNIFTINSKTQREKAYNSSLQKYNNAKQAFEYEIARLNIKDNKKAGLLSQMLDAGVYRTSIPHFGFDFNKLVSEAKDPRQIATRAEIVLHTEKFENGAKVLKQFEQLSSLTQIEEALLKAGNNARNNFIKKHRTYPEAKIGFLNTFCEMISKQLEINPLLKDRIIDKDTPTMADSLIDVILKLKTQFLNTKDKEEKKEIDLQMKKIQEALEGSNQHNI